MATFDFNVDTIPMADSVNRVTGHIQGTTAAVVAMQAAVIASEQKAAQEICENVDSGFYNLIHSHISTKLASQFTRMNAKLSLLLEYSKALARSRSRMESDFNRLRREYLKIFGGLDKALENRIAQLDSDASALSGIRSKMIFGRMKRDVSETAVVSNEVNSADQMLVLARIKDKTSRSISMMGNKVHEGEHYKSLMNDMMEDGRADERSERYVPVVYSNEQSMVLKESYVTQFHFPEYLSADIKSRMEMEMLGSIAELSAKPKAPDEQRRVVEEFRAILSQSGLDERVADVMVYLFERGGC